MRNTLFLNGSLRAGALNARLTRVATAQLSGDCRAKFTNLGDVPFYTEDPRGDHLSAVVTDLRAAISGADSVLVRDVECGAGSVAATTGTRS